MMNTSLFQAVRRYLAHATLLTAVAVLCAGCSSAELSSFDDTFVPEMTGQNFPIQVVERPFKLTLVVPTGGLATDQSNQVAAFADMAAKRASTPVTVAYSARSTSARKGANQAAQILAREGVARAAILITPKDGTGSELTLVFAAKVTQTKPCGDFSENLAGNQFNLSGPSFGCAYQQNAAAMIANPDDLLHPRASTPALSAAQDSFLESYYGGDWTAPISDGF